VQKKKPARVFLFVADGNNGGFSVRIRRCFENLRGGFLGREVKFGVAV